jgi:predicted GNAT family acetyltransferase
MKAIFYDNISKFYDLALPFLLEKEAENNLLLGLLNIIKDDPYRYGEDFPVLTSVFDKKKLKLITLRTPPFNQVLSYTDDLRTIEILVDALNNKGYKIPGVLGQNDAVGRFRELWCKEKNLRAKLTMNERIYKLESVAEETLGSRVFKLADNTCKDLVIKWAREFLSDAFSESEVRARPNWKVHIQRSLDEQRIFLLYDNEKPVSMARRAGQTPNGVTVNLVYTPPALRRKGYATECVAKLSKLLLNEGNKFCFLFTDLANPTSNSIYKKIGYRPIIDVDQYEFVVK